MTTAIVIPVYNGLTHLQANLPFVLKLKPNEIVLVDDASTDGSAGFIQQYPKIKLISHASNVGFPQTVNDGFSICTADIVFLLNQDVLPDSQLIKNTLPLFADSQVAAVTFNEHNRSWAKASFVNGFIEYSNGSTMNHELSTHNSFWASGGSAAFRRDIWNRMGGFDPIFSPGYFEDLDLGYRLHKSGFDIVWSPRAGVTHSPETAFSQAYSPRKLQHLKERNYLLMHWKNLDLANLIRHFLALLDRVLVAPGYIVPVLLALGRLPYLRRKNYPVSDAQVFAKFHA